MRTPIRLSAALALTLLACGDDDSPETSLDAGVDSGLDASITPDSALPVDTGTPTPPAEAPLYAAISVPATAMGAPVTSYLILSDKLTGELKTENAALEVAGSALTAGQSGSKRLFIGTNLSGLLTRYDLDAAGKLNKTGDVNFEARQVPNFNSYASNFQFIDKTKAYYLALGSAKLIVWNPDALTLTGEVALPQLVRPDPANPGTNYTTSVTGAPIRKDDKLYFFTAWDSRTAGVIKMAPAATAIVIDTKTDAVTVVVDEGTCGYTRDGVVDGDWIYLVTEGAGTAINYLNNANGAPPCMRRFNIKTQQFDAAYKPDLTTVAGGPAGSLVTSPNGQAFIYVLDKAAADPMIGPAMGQINNPRFLAIGALWKQVRLKVGDNPTVEPLNLPLASGSVLPHVLHQGFKVTATFDAAPQLREVTDNGVVATEQANAKLFGNTSSIVQLR